MEFAPKLVELKLEPLKLKSPEMEKKEFRLEPGERLFNRFTLVSELGRGRCSVAWLVEDPRFRRQSVLKIFQSSGEENLEAERAIWRDYLRRLRILNHPDVVITMEYFQEGLWLALSSIYENGPTLAALTLQTGRKLALPQIEEFLKSVGSALAAAQEKCQLVHGNLNAYNILVPTRRSSAKITDFGFHPPTPPSDAPLTDELRWKIACQSPERRRGAPPSHEDDLFAFAAVAFQLFTGKNPPLNSEGAVDSSAASGLLMDAPEKWRQPLLRALSPLEERPKDIATLLRDLGIYEEFTRTQALSATEGRRPPSSRKKALRPRKMPRRDLRNKGRLLRIVTALCVILAPAAIAWVSYQTWLANRALVAQRYEDEQRERILEAQEENQVFQLNDRLGTDFAPSRANLDLYRETMSAPALAQKRKPLAINSGAQAFFGEGETKMAAGDAAGALVSYELAIVLQPDWPELLEARGEAMLQLKRPADALLEFSEALVIEPTRIRSLIGRAQAHLAAGDKKSAAADLQSALKLEPENSSARELMEKNQLTGPVQ